MNEESFLSKTLDDGFDTKELRQNLVDKFRVIQKSVPCAHGLPDSFYMADYLLRYRHIDGVMVEFGCYAGGMTAKLSHVAQIIGKKYYVFDSFMGLLQSAKYETYDERYSSLGKFEVGQFASSLENTKSNIEKYGNVDSCIFVPGVIEINLESFTEKVMFCFIDVDLILTAKQIIKKIWNNVSGSGIFTHEACIKDYMKEILNTNFWLKNFNSKPPSCLSDYLEKPNRWHGLPLANCLDFLIKQKDLKYL